MVSLTDVDDDIMMLMLYIAMVSLTDTDDDIMMMIMMLLR